MTQTEPTAAPRPAKILVPIKFGPASDEMNRVRIGSGGRPEGVEVRVSPLDEYALEAALRLTEEWTAWGKRVGAFGEVIAVSIGPEAWLAEAHLVSRVMGADRVILISADDSSLDAAVVARALQAVVRAEDPDLVITGAVALDTEESAVPQWLGSVLHWPTVTMATAIEVLDGGRLAVRCRTDQGLVSYRLRWPAVISVCEGIAYPNAVINGMGASEYPDGVRYGMAIHPARVRREHPPRSSLQELGVAAGPLVNYTRFELPAIRPGECKVVYTVDELLAGLASEAIALAKR